MSNFIKNFENYLKDIEGQGYVFDKDTRKCRICGCTQFNGCPGGCYWITDDLCSHCLKYSDTDLDPMISEEING